MAYVDPNEDRTILAGRPYLPKWLETPALDVRIGAGVVDGVPAALPERLSEASLSATYVRFLDTEGNPIEGSLVTIVVDTVNSEIADIIVEEI